MKIIKKGWVKNYSCAIFPTILIWTHKQPNLKRFAVYFLKWYFEIEVKFKD